MRRPPEPSHSSIFAVLRSSFWDRLGDVEPQPVGGARARSMVLRPAKARPSRCSRPGQVPSAGTAMDAVTEALP